MSKAVIVWKANPDNSARRWALDLMCDQIRITFWDSFYAGELTRRRAAGVYDRRRIRREFRQRRDKNERMARIAALSASHAAARAVKDYAVADALREQIRELKDMGF